jgi:cobalt-zinc-cadmium efflux system membrane fusion protein
VIGSAELQRRESELDDCLVPSSAAAADQLRVLGVSLRTAIRRFTRGRHQLGDAGGGDDGRFGGRAPGGAGPGGAAQPTRCFRSPICRACGSTAEVPEQQAGQGEAWGQSVDIEIPALGSRGSPRKLIYVADTVDPETRTVTVRSELDNTRPAAQAGDAGHLADRGRGLSSGWWCPVGAVVRENDADTCSSKYRQPRQATALTPVACPRAAGMRAGAVGTQAGQKIVVEGAFHMNNERKRKELE